ncbi:nucleotide exchange factor GrpE [Roseiconus lacunae]|uniref:nucleotide exchange factor GrpE n=1 Tax=Roseiconus lacunae TaxID=2605694 RepID=UPI001E301AA1|nr:nucleotide exchange factor GrpE [Roseiconus lacunae]MCD0462477.1 nucleotide exchange factor GrpE [Roseiconus lacunae]
MSDYTEDVDESQTEEPQFGLVDIVEAFTALRHEYRTQSKEARQLADQLKETTERVALLQQKLSAEAKHDRIASGEDVTASLTKSLIEFDTQLTRAVDMAISCEHVLRSSQLERDRMIQQTIAGLSRIARWFARPLIKTLRQNRDELGEEQATISAGLSILLAKVRETLNAHGIDRVDTEGQPFDGAMMNSIGVVESVEVPSGHVVVQLSAAYLKNNRVLRYADVRVAS